MLNNSKIKEAFDRKQKILEAKPFIGKGSVTTHFKITDGTTCEISEGNWKLVADMSEQGGGNNQGPTPGTYGRAAFGSCLAISYMMIASQMEVQIDSLEIEVQVDYDARGMYYFDNVRSGYSEIRYHLKVQSPASEEQLQKIMDEVEKHSSYLDNFGNTVPIKSVVEVIKS